MARLDNYLARHAAEKPEHVALICGSERVNYSQLYERVRKESLTWESSKGKAVIVRSSQTIDFIITYFAVHVAGKIIVPLESDLPDTRFENIKRVVEEHSIPEDISDILFTTGTTGRQKGVMISHKAIIANAENLIDAQGYTKDTTFIISGPLNHIGNLSKVWPIMMLGATLLITKGIKDMGAFFTALEYPSSTFATFLVPASIRMLIQFASDRLRSQSEKIDFIETGAAPMAQGDMQTLRELLPHTRLYNTYASTETGIISTYDYAHNECIAGCLGQPMKHASIQITETGNVACKGPMLMSGYLGDPALTHTVLRDGTLYTSDIGLIDAQGRLRLQGRMDDVINIGGYKVSPVEVENQAMSCPEIKDCICISANHPVIGPVLKLLYVTNDPATFSQKALIKHLKERLESHKLPFYYAQVDKIERTYNGKINRNYYKPKAEKPHA